MTQLLIISKIPILHYVKFQTGYQLIGQITNHCIETETIFVENLKRLYI